MSPPSSVSFNLLLLNTLSPHTFVCNGYSSKINNSKLPFYQNGISMLTSLYDQEMAEIYNYACIFYV